MKFFEGMKNGCLISIPLWVIIIVILTQCACGATAALPTAKTLPSPTAQSVNMVVYANTSTPDVAPRRQAVTLGAVNVRKLPNTQADVWGVLEYGETITVGTYIENDDWNCWRWYEVVFDGHSGWVCAEWLATK